LARKSLLHIPNSESESVGDNISYVVHNLTKRTIVLSDLRAEIGPHKMLDLEKVAERSAIDRSYDLRLALNTKRIRLCSQGVVSKTAKPEVLVVEKIIEKHHHHETQIQNNTQTLDEARLVALMKKVMLENQVAPQPAPVASTDSSQQILEAMNALNSKIESMGGEGSSDGVDMPSIDPVKLAELQAKAIGKLSENIETGIKKTGKKVILKNTRLGDLVNELGD